MEWSRGRTIGRGSSATVSLATTPSGALFAVKSAELPQSHALQREHQILTSLGSSPHIVSYMGCDISSETIHNNKIMFNLLMEYAAAGTLSDAARLDDQATGRYTWQIVKGLEYLHAKGYAHCDIKGSNILITKNGAKIADFGCAKRVCSDSPIRGTPAFMAPEVARGEEQGFAGDIWSLGCTVVEMASGSPPWTDAADPVAVLYRVGFSGDVPAVPRWLSGEGRDFLGKCLRRDPRERWTAGQLLNHPFLAEFNSEEKRFNFWESNSGSPISVLDGYTCLWGSDEESESVERQRQSHAIPGDSAEERIGRLCVIDHSHGPSWRFEEDWITVRFDDDVVTSEEASSMEPWR